MDIILSLKCYTGSANKAYGSYVKETLESSYNICLSHCWLVVRTHPEVPATGHLDTRFRGFPVSFSK